MPLHDEMAALSGSDLCARLDECHKALEAERSVQFEAMKLAVAVFAENKASFDQHVAQIPPSMPLHNEMAALRALRLSESDLRARLDKCHKALEAERFAQFEAMKLGAAAVAENASFDQVVAQISASVETVQMMTPT